MPPDETGDGNRRLRQRAARRTHRLEIDHPADDQADDVVLGDRAGGDGAGDAAVAQHRGAVGDRVDLVDVVRDEDDARALGDNAADQREQALDVALRQERRRLVEDEQRRRSVRPAELVEGADDGK